MATVRTDVAPTPKDCFGCRAVGSAGLVGIGGYLANFAWKNKTFLGRVTLSTFSLAFVSLGIARYKQTYPFQKAQEDTKKKLGKKETEAKAVQ